MEQFLKFLQQFNTSAGIVGGLMTPTGAIGALIATIQRIRERRAAGEITPEQAAEQYEAAVAAFDAAVGKLVEANAEYWLIPEKPAEAQPAEGEAFRIVADDGGQPRP